MHYNFVCKIDSRFSTFGLSEAELNGGGGGYRPAAPAAYSGYRDSERVGLRGGNIPLGFLATSLRFLSYLVSI